jgi:hypothetical protein
MEVRRRGPHGCQRWSAIVTAFSGGIDRQQRQAGVQWIHQSRNANGWQLFVCVGRKLLPDAPLDRILQRSPDRRAHTDIHIDAKPGAGCVKDYYSQKGYRSNLLYVGHRIAQDQKSLLSYSFDGNVMTIDPVSTANPGWFEFLDAYNQWCSDRNGKPLLNQTPQLTPAILQKANGDKLKTLSDLRRQYDPQDRLLNDYFRTLLS